MAKIYSNLYAPPADQPKGPFAPKGPTPLAAQTGVEAAAVIKGAVGNGDVLYLRRMVPGEALQGMDMDHTVDSNITTAALVYRPTDGSADLSLAAGSALLDGTASNSLAFTAITAANRIVPDNGKEYDLCWIAGAAGLASVHTHYIRTIQTGT